MRNKRLSDQVLILQSIACVREELAEYGRTSSDVRVEADIMERLSSLYACLDVLKLSKVIKQVDKRGMHGKPSKHST